MYMYIVCEYIRKHPQLDESKCTFVKMARQLALAAVFWKLTAIYWTSSTH